MFLPLFLCIILKSLLMSDDQRMASNKTLKGIQVVIFAVCATVFLLMAKQHYDSYVLEPTGSALSSQSVTDMPFPAITICDSHFEYARASAELDFPLSGAGQEPSEVVGPPPDDDDVVPGAAASPPVIAPPPDVEHYPLDFYAALASLNVSVVDQLWKYHFTLDKVIVQRNPLFEVDLTCRVGSDSCGYSDGDRLLGRGNEESVELAVPAGK